MNELNDQNTAVRVGFLLIIPVILIVGYYIYQQYQITQLPQSETKLYPFVSAPIAVNGTPFQPSDTDILDRKAPEKSESREILIDENMIKVDDNVITFSNGWRVTKGIRGTGGTDWGCYPLDLSDSCKIYTITNGINEFYISTPVIAFKEIIAIFGQTQEVKLSTLLGEKDFIMNPYVLVMKNEAGEDIAGTGSLVIGQITGCLKENICLASALLDTNLETNKSQVDEFKEFVASIIIN